MYYGTRSAPLGSKLPEVMYGNKISLVPIVLRMVAVQTQSLFLRVNEYHILSLPKGVCKSPRQLLTVNLDSAVCL